MLKVIIADDHKVYREGFKLVVNSINNVSVVAEAENGNQLLDILKKKKADIVFMDINMPGLGGIEATKKALEIAPDIKIIALTSLEGTEFINKMLYAGVEGYMLKDADYNEFEEAIENVTKGKNYFSSKILMNLTKNTFENKKEEVRKKKLPQLTKREKEVLTLICNGNSKTEISDQLNISERTVEKHKENLLSKTETSNTVNLVIYAFKNKLAEV